MFTYTFYSRQDATESPFLLKEKYCYMTKRGICSTSLFRPTKYMSSPTPQLNHITGPVRVRIKFSFSYIGGCTKLTRTQYTLLFTHTHTLYIYIYIYIYIYTYTHTFICVCVCVCVYCGLICGTRIDSNTNKATPACK